MENNIEPINSKKNTSLVVILIILLLLAIGYIIYDKVIIGDTKEIVNENENETLDGFDITENQREYINKFVGVFNHPISGEPTKTEFDLDANNTYKYGYFFNNDVDVISMSDEIKINIALAIMTNYGEKQLSSINKDDYDNQNFIKEKVNTEDWDLPDSNIDYFEKYDLEETLKETFGEKDNTKLIEHFYFEGRDFLYDSITKKYVKDSWGLGYGEDERYEHFIDKITKEDNKYYVFVKPVFMYWIEDFSKIEIYTTFNEFEKATPLEIINHGSNISSETYNKLNTHKFTFIKDGDNLIFESVEKIN